MVVPIATSERLRKLNRVRWLFGLGLVQRWMKGKVRAGGPASAKRDDSACSLWGEVKNAAGKEVKKQLTTVNGYDLTALTAIGVLDHLLAQHPAGGFYTASQLMGADYILSLPGSSLR